MAESKTFDFNNRRIKALPPQLPDAAANAAAYSDSGVSGLKLEVTKANRKTFIFRFVLDGQRGYARIGEFPAVDVAEARKAAMEMKGLIERGLNPNDVGDRAHAVIPTFRDFAMEEFVPYILEMGKRTAKDDISKLNHHLLARFGDKKLSAIGRRDIELYHAAVRDSHTPATANRHLALLSAIFRRAVDWERIEKNPCTGVKMFQENNASERFLTETEIAKLVQAMDADPNQTAAAALKMLLLCGARRNEVAKLKWNALDLERGVWLLHGDDTKNGKTRRVALSWALVALLQTQPSLGVSEWVFPGRDGVAKPINNLTKPFNRMLKAAGLEKARIHDLRHTHASMLLASGVDAVVVKNALGHSSLNVTARYMHLVDTSLKSASEAMARVVGRAAGSATGDMAPDVVQAA